MVVVMSRVGRFEPFLTCRYDKLDRYRMALGLDGGDTAPVTSVVLRGMLKTLCGDCWNEVLVDYAFAVLEFDGRYILEFDGRNILLR
jgi:hypothetical protein